MVTAGMGPNVVLVAALCALVGLGVWFVVDLARVAVGSGGVAAPLPVEPAARRDRRVMRLRSGLAYGRADGASLENLRLSLVDLVDDQLRSVHRIDRREDPERAGRTRRRTRRVRERSGRGSRTPEATVTRPHSHAHRTTLTGRSNGTAPTRGRVTSRRRGARRGRAGRRRQARRAHAGARRDPRRRTRAARGLPGPGQDARRAIVRPGARTRLRPRAVHARPAAGRPDRVVRVRPAHGRVRVPPRPAVHRAAARRRDQPDAAARRRPRCSRRCRSTRSPSRARPSAAERRSTCSPPPTRSSTRAPTRSPRRSSTGSCCARRFGYPTLDEEYDVLQTPHRPPARGGRRCARSPTPPACSPCRPPSRRVDGRRERRALLRRTWRRRPASHADVLIGASPRGCARAGAGGAGVGAHRAAATT